MKMIVEGMPRPSAIDVAFGREAGYQSLRLEEDGNMTFTEHRVELVEHEPCGWKHPTWPDEAEGRLAAHLTTCEMR